MKRSYTFGVVGQSIGYSQSPEIFRAISEIKGFQQSFVLHDIEPSQFASQFPVVLKSGIDGFSVTIPHKKRVMPFLDLIEKEAELIGAVNSVGVREGRAFGFNTDRYGFAVPLAKHRHDLEGGTAVIFGAGGAARAVVYSLGSAFGIRRFYIIGRDLIKLQTFCSSFRATLPNIAMTALPIGGLSENAQGILYDIIVNCTPLGGWNHPDQSPIPSDWVWLPGRLYYDLSYNSDNKIVAQASNNGLIAYDGSAMLIGQAIRSFELWTGMAVDFEPVYDAVFGSV